MELQIENKVSRIYTEIDHQIKTIQEVSESVVPDKNEDIAKIASVQSSVLLKSKELSGRTVRVSAEAQAAVLYITEAEDKISALQIKIPFEIEFQAENADAETLTRIDLVINNAETRIINPRKLSLCLEISAELSCYKPETVNTEAELPEERPAGIHIKRENTEATVLKRICEKSFTLSEQFIISGDEAAPAELLFQIPKFTLREAQQIGSKIIIKADAEIDCCYKCEGDLLRRKTFTAAFSQIIDAEEEGLENFSADIQLTGAYFELIDTINGEKALDAELHALIQLSCSRKVNISYISDAYNNTMPCECRMKNTVINEYTEKENLEFHKEEQISIPEPFDELLMLTADISQSSAVKGKLRALLNLDIIYAVGDGKLGAARRILNIEENIPIAELRIIKKSIKNIQYQKENDGISVKFDIMFEMSPRRQREISYAEVLELPEDERYDLSELPGLSMVRRENESLWELAKKYHSSVESIEFMNPERAEEENELLLILKECN